MFSHYGGLLPPTQGFLQSVRCTGSSKALQDLGCPTNVLTMSLWFVEKWMIKEHNSLRFINMSKGIQSFQKTQELKAGCWGFWKRLYQANTQRWPQITVEHLKNDDVVNCYVPISISEPRGIPLFCNVPYMSTADEELCVHSSAIKTTFFFYNLFSDDTFHLHTVVTLTNHCISLVATVKGPVCKI